MDTIRWIISTAPEIFLLLAIAVGTVLGRLRIKGFSIGTTACTLIVAVILGQLGSFVFPPLFKSIFFSLFVFTIGYKSGPEFFASLSIRTLSQVGVALVVGFGFGHSFRARGRQPHAVGHDRNGVGSASATRSA